MSIDKTCITSVTDAKIATANSSCATCDLVALSATTNRITTDRKSYAALSCDLPDLNLGTIPEGTIYYVQELEVPVVATDQAWTGLDGRTYRQDITFYQVYSWGKNDIGQLGVNDLTCRSSPSQEVSSSNDWCDISNANHTIGIKTDGTLWGWGCNINGQLGVNDLTCRSSPSQEVSSSNYWCCVSVYRYSTSAVKSDGTLWAWGAGARHRLGTGSLVNYCSPVQEACSRTGWIKTSVGEDHGAAIKDTGELYSWGFNAVGQIGIGDTSIVTAQSPIQDITSATDWCDVSSGQQQTGAVKTDGSIYMWGLGDRGRLGNNSVINHSSPVREISSSSNWCRISTGSFHTIALKTDGALWGWGSDYFGQIGDGTTCGGLYDGWSSPVQEFCSATNWCAATAHGTQQTGAIKTDGTLWSWGWNGNGQLGTNNTVNRCSPVQEISSSCWCLVSSGYCNMAAIKVV